MNININCNVTYLSASTSVNSTIAHPIDVGSNSNIFFSLCNCLLFCLVSQIYIFVFVIVFVYLLGPGGQSIHNHVPPSLIICQTWQCLSNFFLCLFHDSKLVFFLLVRYSNQWLAQFSFFVLSFFYKLACLIKSHC